MNKANEFKTINMLECLKESFSHTSTENDYCKNDQTVTSTDARRPASILAYLPFLWILGLLLYPNDDEVKFNVNQGIILNTFYLVLNFLISIINFVFAFISPVMLIVSALFYVALGIISIIFIISGIVNAYNKSLKPLPIIGKICVFVK